VHQPGFIFLFYIIPTETITYWFNLFYL